MPEALPATQNHLLANSNPHWCILEESDDFF
jgi:hypothetical protein